ncbi:hypothetical protein WDH52_05840 [Streptomyces sp. TRM70308]|uniref:hypothetical protein n=1 Tax=Streptomyces sp. TRM70308 TaxID=3131932 RepID=UPI003D015B1E
MGEPTPSQAEGDRDDRQGADQDRGTGDARHRTGRGAAPGRRAPSQAEGDRADGDRAGTTRAARPADATGPEQDRGRER